MVGPLAHIWPAWQCSDRPSVLKPGQLTANCSFRVVLWHEPRYPVSSANCPNPINCNTGTVLIVVIAQWNCWWTVLWQPFVVAGLKNTTTKSTAIAWEYHHLLGERLPEGLHSVFMEQNDYMCVTKHETWICASRKISNTLSSGCGFGLSFMSVRLSGSFRWLQMTLSTGNGPAVCLVMDFL